MTAQYTEPLSEILSMPSVRREHVSKATGPCFRFSSNAASFISFGDAGRGIM